MGTRIVEIGNIIGFDTPDPPEEAVLGLVPAIETACLGVDLGDLIGIYLRFPSDEDDSDSPWETVEEPETTWEVDVEDLESGPIGDAIYEALFNFSDCDTLVEGVLEQRPLSYSEHDTLAEFAEPFVEIVFRVRDELIDANPAVLDEAGAEGRDYFLHRVTAEVGVTLFLELQTAVKEYRKGLY